MSNPRGRLNSYARVAFLFCFAALLMAPFASGQTWLTNNGEFSTTANVALNTGVGNTVIPLMIQRTGDVLNTTANYCMRVGDPTSNYGFLMGYDVTNNLGVVSGVAGNGIGFLTASGGPFVERMRITAGGNVGIGVTNPNIALQVGGRARVDTPFDTGTLGAMTLYCNSSNPCDGLDSVSRGSGSGSTASGGWGVNGAGQGTYGVGVSASEDATGGVALFAQALSPATNAGYFIGNVNITGTLSKGGGSFKIDHPLDPASKYLYHSFVESPDMKNIYDGVVVLDRSGSAVVQLPDWFDALNEDFRYQLTCLHGFAPVYIDEEISGNRFKIAGGKAGMKISWQVTGIRHDAWANAHRIPVEEEKPQGERGLYLYPLEQGQPETLGVNWETTRRVLAGVQRQ